MLQKIGNDLSAREFLSQAKFYEGYSRFNTEKGRYENWTEAVDRVMNMHKTKYAHLVGNPEFDSMIARITDAYKEKLFLGAQRALQFGGEQLLKHEMRLYNCFSPETKFVTNVGMKSFLDFKDGDETTVLTHTGNWRVAKIKKFGKQPIKRITFTKGNGEYNILATENHRWILYDGSETTKLKEGDRLYKEPKSFELFSWENSTPEEKLYWVYGFVYGDGTVTNNGHSMVRLCGHDKKYEERFLELGFKTSSSSSLDGDIMAFTGTYKKTLPDPEKDSIELLRAFVRGYMDADGSKNIQLKSNGSKFVGIQSSNPESIEFIRKVFPIVGVNIISEKDLTGQKTNYGIRPYTILFRTNDSSGSKYNSGWKVKSITESGTDDVWCLEVEDDHSFVLEGGIVTGNCSGSYADRPAFFNEFFYILLCGAGAGYSVQKHHIAKLPAIKPRTRHVRTHVIEDSIEGWADALAALMSSFFVGGGVMPQYEGKCVYFDPSLVRRKGSMISGGFLAPGPKPLIDALFKVEAILNERAQFGFLRPIDVYDISCHVADAVLSGGVRRAATICLFSPDDTEMLNAKTGNWYNLEPQRARSNNSMVLLRNQVTLEFFLKTMESVKQFGEPGFIFVDDLEQVFNPCVEISFFPQIDGESGWQQCNLVEGNGAAIKSKEDFFRMCRVAAELGTIQAGYTNFKYVSDATRRITEREALLGVSLTGWMNSPDILLNADTLRKGVEIIMETNKKVAKLLGINPAARATCVKPSGNASTLLGCAPATQGEHSERYLRISQMNKDTPVAKLMVEKNPYMIEESVWSEGKTDYVIMWPVIAPKGSKFKDDLHGTKFLENVKFIQDNWIKPGVNLDLCVNPKINHHNVSNTVTVKNDDWENVAKFVYENREYFAGISFISETGDKDYAQAPFTAVLTPSQIVKKYGDAALFASGLIVDSRNGFRDLWDACNIAINNGVPAGELKDTQSEWIRRFHKFADNFFDGDLKKTEYCMKDVDLLHKWNKIQQTIVPVDFNEHFDQQIMIDVDTMGAVACSAGVCELK